MQNVTRRLWPAIVLLILLALATTGCSGQPTGGTVQDVTSRAVDLAVQYMPQISLPRITLAYDEAGVPSVFGVKLSSIARIVPLDLSAVELPPERVRWLMDRNVQHLELDMNDSGLFIYVNSKALPYLGWNEDSLAYAGDLLDRLDVVASDATIAKAVPLLGRLGVDVLVTFPLPAGETAIPVRDRSQRALVEPRTVSGERAVIHAVIDYSSDGVPSIAGITSREIGQLLQTDLSSIELPQSDLTLVKAAGVQEAAVVSQPDGLHVLVNGRELPYLAYDPRHLTNAIDLYAQISADEQSQVVATLLQNVQLIIYGADIDVVVQFPDGG